MTDDDGHVIRFAVFADDEWQRLYKPLELTPEKKLFAAVLQDAWKSFEENIGAATEKRQRLCNEARYWFRNRTDHWIFAFENVCWVLDINPDPIRRRIRDMDHVEAVKQVTSEVRDGGWPSASIERPAQQ